LPVRPETMNFFYFVIIFMTSAVIAGLLLVIMVRKYYWGPTGLPPKERYKKTGEAEAQTTVREPTDNS
jgi:hypothetical protein